MPRRGQSQSSIVSCEQRRIGRRRRRTSGSTRRARVRGMCIDWTSTGSPSTELSRGELGGRADELEHAVQTVRFDLHRRALRPRGRAARRAPGDVQAVINAPRLLESMKSPWTCRRRVARSPARPAEEMVAERGCGVQVELPARPNTVHVPAARPDDHVHPGCLPVALASVAPRPAGTDVHRASV